MRNKFFFGVMILIVLCTAELFGFLAWAIAEGRFIPPRTVQAFLKDASNVRRRGKDKEEKRLQSGYRAPHRVIHPYIGYENPNHPIETFDLPTEPDPNELCVLITGGSVAEQLQDMEDRMIDRLSATSGKSVRIINVAVGGYKQPQQLNTLSYLIALGYTCDVVINLDGFNEYDLVFDNAEDGKNPWYPYKRLWSQPVGELRDMYAGAIAWELIHKEDRRESVAHFLNTSLIGRSYLVTVFWRFWDSHTLNTMEALRKEMEVQQSQAEYNLSADGPPFDPDPAVLMVQSAEIWARSSRLMHEIATGHDMQYLHFLQPNQYIPGSKEMGATETRIVTGEMRHTEYVPQFYEHFQKEGVKLQSNGVQFFDLTNIYRDTPEQAYRDIDTHLSPLGNEILSDAIVEEILRL